jgi:hypothetical protein
MSWILYFETGRILLSPVPHVEPPALVREWVEPDSRIACLLAAEEMIDKYQLKAWCEDTN